MEVTGSYKELSEVLAELERSPEARRLLSPALFESLHKESLQNTSSDESSDSEQKTE
jgi:hypothetical protein